MINSLSPPNGLISGRVGYFVAKNHLYRSRLSYMISLYRIVVSAITRDQDLTSAHLDYILYWLLEGKIKKKNKDFR